MASPRWTLRLQLIAMFVVFVAGLVALAAAVYFTGLGVFLVATILFIALGAAGIFWWFDRRLLRSLGEAVAD